MNLFGAGDSKVYTKKLSAILVLTQYCAKMPTLTYNKLISTPLYIKLFDALSDSKAEVRHAAIDFFKSISILIIQRDPNERRNFYDTIYGRAISAIKSTDQNLLHGCLLVMTFIIKDSDELMIDKHAEMFKLIISLREKKGDLIRPQCIQMFPIMADFGSHAFSKYIDTVVVYLLDTAKSKSSMKGHALKSLGKLSVIICKDKFRVEYIQSIVQTANTEIETPKSNYFNESLDVIANLCRVHGSFLEYELDIIQLINSLFRDGLSQNLIHTLDQLSKISGGKFKKAIEIKLLNVISLVLSGRQFSFSRNIAAFRKMSDSIINQNEKSVREMSIESGSIFINSETAKQTLGELNSMEKETMKRLMNREVDSKIKTIIQSESKDLMIKLALATLSSFDFRDFAESLTHFFDEVVLNYLDNSNDEIREAAVKTCSNLTISRDGNRIGSVLEKILKKLLKRFLIVATTDPNHSIRCNMLKHMSSQFD
jgi:hypothetical protein